jgi:hypothetical protein
MAVLSLLGCAAVFGHAPSARAAQIIDRDTTGVSLKVDANGTALVIYHAGGAARHVLLWGAVNRGTIFSRDYSGGWKSHRADYKHFHDACAPYTGPTLELAVAACDAPDGSYWALQEWPRLWANYGGHSAVRELYISHWTGALAVLTIDTDWGYHGRWQHLFGTFSYDGTAVFGLAHTRAGVPTDALGRNVYIDSLGARWSRVNSFLTHRQTGGFCYLFSPHEGHTGTGSAYRATANGPGVTPLVRVAFAPPGAYSETTEAQANAAQRQMLGDDPACKIH